MLLYILAIGILPDDDEDIIEELLEMEMAGLSPFEDFRKASIDEKRSSLDKITEIPADSAIGKRADKYLDNLFSIPNEVTQVAYDTEVLRKRDHAEEAVIATVGIRNKQLEMDKQLRVWSRFTGWYSDLVEEDACENAIKDSGVKYVKWVTQNDEKVCAECDDLDGKVFGIDNIPNHPHRGCRCYVVPVASNSETTRRKISTDGHEIIDKPTYNRITESFINSGGIIVRGEIAEQLCESRGATAIYFVGGNAAAITDDATVSDVLEEMHHAYQDRVDMYGEYPFEEMRIMREIEAQEYLISVEDKYKIPVEEREATRANLKYWQERLDNYLSD